MADILHVIDAGAWKAEQPNAVYFDLKVEDKVKRFYLAIREDGALVLKEPPSE